MRTPPRTRIRIKALNLGKGPVCEAAYSREVKLDTLDQRLAGVTARATEVALIKRGRAQCAVLCHLLSEAATRREIAGLVSTSMEHDCLSWRGHERKAQPTTDNSEPCSALSPTHSVRRLGGEQMICRQRFTCSPALSRRRQLVRPKQS